MSIFFIPSVGTFTARCKLVSFMDSNYNKCKVILFWAFINVKATEAETFGVFFGNQYD